jgi:hypothetical protein
MTVTDYNILLKFPNVGALAPHENKWNVGILGLGTKVAPKQSVLKLRAHWLLRTQPPFHQPAKLEHWASVSWSKRETLFSGEKGGSSRPWEELEGKGNRYELKQKFRTKLASALPCLRWHCVTQTTLRILLLIVGTGLSLLRRSPLIFKQHHNEVAQEPLSWNPYHL